MARYPDLRYKFIRGLIKYEYRQRRHQFLKSAAEWTSKAIVSLSLIDYPIRSVKQAMQLEGVGPVIASELKKILQDKTLSEEPPSPGKFPSTGSALLVALLKGTKEARQSGHSDLPLVEEEKLKEFCKPLSEEKFNAKSYTSDGSSVLCPALWRINVLISRGFVKKRTRGKLPVYELLPAGEKLARSIQGDCSPVPKSLPSSADHQRIKDGHLQHLNQNLHENTASSALYSNDDGSNGVVLLVDRHELGGDRVRLGELSRRLSEWQVQHRTLSLPCGDYMWKWRHNGKETTLPILVERKRADDLAESIRDGRYFRQKEKMIQWKQEFGVVYYGDVSLQYVVESEPAAYRVACTDGCNGVGKCGNPTVEQVEAAICGLEDSTDFQLLRTQNLEGTVELLASITAELSQRVEKGEFEGLKDIPPKHMKARSKTPKHRCSIAKEGCNNGCEYVINHETGRNSRTLAGDSRHTRPRKRSHDDLMDNSDEQVSPLKKRWDFSETRRPLPHFYSDGEDDPSHHIPVFHPNTSKSIFGKAEEQSRNSTYCQTIGGITLPFISTEWSDSDDELPPSGITTENDWSRTHLSSGRCPDYGSWSNIAKVEQTDDDKITILRDMLPESSLDDIITALSSTDGNVEMALQKINRTNSKSSPVLGEPDPSSLLQRSGNSGCANKLTTSLLQSDEAKITKIQSALPSSSFEAVIAALATSGGDVEKAVESISRSHQASRKRADTTSSVSSNKLFNNGGRSYELPRAVVEISDNSDQFIISASTSPDSMESSVLKEETSPSKNQTLFPPFDDAKISLVREVLPNASLENIVTALNTSGGKVEQAIIESMRLSEVEDEESKVDKSRVVPVPTTKRYSTGSKTASGKDFTSGIISTNIGISQIGASVNKNDVESHISKISTKNHSFCSAASVDSESCQNIGVKCCEDFKITAVRDVLPDVSTTSIVHALDVTEGKVEEAIVRLLNFPKRFENRMCSVSSTESKPTSSVVVIDLT